MIALDATKRQRPNKESLKELIDYIHENKVLVMADISTYDEAIEAANLGADCVSTTLSGYTNYSRQEQGPDLELIESLSKDLNIPVIGEGKINTPEDLKMAFEKGAYSCVVGGAITRPQQITKRFTDAIQDL